MSKFVVQCLLLLLLLPNLVMGQELVPNGGFETYATCPYKANLLSEATPWYNPNQATPDFYHLCAPQLLMEALPRTGQGQATLFMDFGFAEYLATPLKKPLEAGEAYQFEYYVCSGTPNRYPSGSFGAFFSEKPITSSQKDLLTIPGKPQYLDNSPRRLTQRYKWENAGGCFVAKGAEQYVTIGNFVTLPQSLGLGYYYLVIDDISLKPIRLDLGRDTTLCSAQSTRLLNATTPGATAYQWNTGSTEPTLLVKKPGKYWVTVTTPCKTLRDTVTIDYRLYFSLGRDTTLCEGQTMSLSVSLPGTYRWQDGSQQRQYLVNRQGTYTVRVTDGNCIAGDTVQVRYILPPKLDLGPDRELCGAEVYTLNPSFAEGKFRWLDSFAEVPRRVNSSDVFYASVTNDCATLVDSVIIDYSACECTINAPDAFSPNGDSLNDTFEPFACGDITLQSLTVYNRWGQTIFQTDSAPFAWNGTFGGERCPSEVYIWKASYTLKRFRKPPLQLTKQSRILLVQ